MRRHDQLTAVLAEAKRVGAKVVEIRRRQHIHVVLRHQGRERLFVLPSTPSDRRGTLNSLADLRRILGVRRESRKGGRS